MSMIKEQYQDQQGNWTPEAEAILAKATGIAKSHTQPEGTLMPLDEVENFILDLYEGVQ